MEIRNEVKQKDAEKKEFVHRSLADVQRAKLSKLMENPEKPVNIPEFVSKKDKDYQAPSFVRNVMGSSAGAGSGEFHVYRHLRRKEFSRQKYMKALTETERLDQEYQQRLDDNQKLAEAKTNKKREKRKKRKMNQRNKGKKAKVESNEESEELSEHSDSESEKVDEDPEENTVEKVDEDPAKKDPEADKSDSEITVAPKPEETTENDNKDAETT